MKSKIKCTISCLMAMLFPSLLATPARAIDLLERYPTTLTAGDAEPSHARVWQFNPADIFHVTRFEFKTGDKFKLITSDADLGIGHCGDGAVWAVLIPRDQGTLTSPAAAADEAVAHVWLRFHPGELDHLFPADTVLEAGNTNLAANIQFIARSKMTSSWQAGGQAMIPDPKFFTVYADTRNGSHRFFMVDTQAQTAEYVAAFDTHADASGSPLSWETAPPVVIKTVPEAGATDVAAGQTEIKVTFNKEMAAGCWSWCDVGGLATPESVGSPKYDADGKTCVFTVKLEPGQAYGYWLNTKNYRNFKDKTGHPAVPYLLVFQTKPN